MMNTIQIKGAKENNLKNVSLSIPKNKLVVITGPSGSGKSTLAMDTLQRECQRQYMESMGMTTDSLSKPKVESINGLSPSISVGQHVTNRNPRSTVGTITDMYTFLRLIFEKLGERPCPHCQTIIIPYPDKESFDEESSGFKQVIHCPQCDNELEKFTRSHFSFNKPEGACDECSGLGKVVTIDIDAVFNQELSLRDGAVSFWYESYREYQISTLMAAAKYYELAFNPTLPLKEYSHPLRDLLYYGAESEEFMVHFPDKKPPKTVSNGKFEGVLTGMWRRYREKDGQSSDAELFYEQTCQSCQGARLKQEILEVKVAGHSISDITRASIEKLFIWLSDLQQNLKQEQLEMVETFLYDLTLKSARINNVGLGYLTLDRQTISLSGGEAQRLRLASILGSALTGVLYILDEPTAGLHPKDTAGLVSIMKELRDLGNTVLVIEHDIDVIKAADHVIDMGPGAGTNGGTVIGEGHWKDLLKQEQSITAPYLQEKFFPSTQRRKGSGKYISIQNATKHNLKNVSVSFPLGCLTSVSGVSGSGKSSLVFDVLASGETKSSQNEAYEKITGFDEVSKLIKVDQSPLGRMQRSNIATYTDAFTLMRNLFASLPKAKELELKPKDFSFNTPGGRCENCSGLGFVSINMHFLPDLEVQCPACRGRRFTEKILEVTYKNHTISSILDLTIEESLQLFKEQKKLAVTTKLLTEIGLGYLKWGQSVTTLSGGEGQRLKLSKELNKKSSGHTLYLLDEPSTGLHPSDVSRLLLLLNKLVDAGNTVIIVEHNIDLIKESDWVIDMGPDGGVKGGNIVAVGSPEEIANERASFTGAFLKGVTFA
ncbi:excinuclease ABC subunit UvrA [Cytobacillus horneckiae]|uniref:excinuclease ABC subunit UvrA n=1 Tax=Cytobacillus horneckiae TaxID=549687 RepID=UPI003D9A9DF0